MATAPIESLAKLLDLTPRRVQQLAKEGVIPKPATRGQYDIIPSVVAYIRQDRKHELAILDRQMEQQRLGHSQHLEEIQIAADVAESQALYNYANHPTGSPWVEALPFTSEDCNCLSGSRTRLATRTASSTRSLVKIRTEDWMSAGRSWPTAHWCSYLRLGRRDEFRAANTSFMM